MGANHVTLIFLTNSIYGSPYDTYVSTLAMAITAPPYSRLTTAYITATETSCPVIIAHRHTRLYIKNDIPIAASRLIPICTTLVFPYDIHITNDIMYLIICGIHINSRPVNTLVEKSCRLVTGIE